MIDADLKKALEENLDAFTHEAEAARQIGHGSRIIRQKIYRGVIVEVEEIERKVCWKIGKKV